MSWSVNSSLGPDLVVQAFGIDRACGRPAPWIRPLVASLMSIYFTGNHRQYTFFEYIVKLCFAKLYSCVLSEISLLLLLLTVDSLQKFCLTVKQRVPMHRVLWQQHLGPIYVHDWHLKGTIYYTRLHLYIFGDCNNSVQNVNYWYY